MSSNKSSDEPQQIDLTKLNLPQLQQLKMEFESELSVFQESLQTLVKCKGKYSASKEALEQIKPDWENKEILVPLTGSMYIPGVVKSIDNFIIEIGTGYYIEKDLSDSKDYFKRKIDYVQEQIEKIDKIQVQKSRVLGAVQEVIEIKVVAMQQAAIKQTA
ncbi:probable prefoldin subunit 5 [Condylostylus longicornis]|uniref:probable prefoldin subunit 5 n=1 Tax=Condylostylus longicornis TaxID=2530218 RepID=UPI00244E106F|nr:probable prefoldin subunit 5 [Condylostylus longicornis]